MSYWACVISEVSPPKNLLCLYLSSSPLSCFLLSAHFGYVCPSAHPSFLPTFLHSVLPSFRPFFCCVPYFLSSPRAHTSKHACSQQRMCSSRLTMLAPAACHRCGQTAVTAAAVVTPMDPGRWHGRLAASWNSISPLCHVYHTRSAWQSGGARICRTSS